ncbi:T9SS type B sorting domain-containing protein [Maribacter sp.]|nr:T9SS type B sorting domain-containing protein [Maribacter sp.]
MHPFFKALGLHKKILLFTLILCATSLFAYVFPTELFVEEQPFSVEKTEIISGTHPLIGISDNIVICSSDGREVHEIYLCGASDERLLTTNIPNLKQLVWSRLEEGSCATTTANCPSTSPSCTWIQQGTNTQFNLTEGGDYQIFVQYNDNSSERFYFNVFENGLDPNAVVTNIDCGNPGSIAITNVPSTYEYSITNGASWQDSNVFEITSVTTYDVQIRRKNDTDGCVFNLDDIAVGNNAINATAIIIPINCNATNGGIQIDIADASSSYVYKLLQGGNLLNSSGPITDSSYTFTNLGAGTYDIEVTLASVSNCSWSATQTIAPFQNTAPSAVVTKNIDCTDGIITLTHSGGNGPYQYSIDNGVSYVPFAMANQTIVPISMAGSYVFKLKDINECEIDSNTVTMVNETEIVYSLSHTDISCNGSDDGKITVDVTDTKGYSITYSLDGTTFQNSNVFSNLVAATYTVTIRKQKAGGSCDITAAPETVNDSPAFNADTTVSQAIDCSNGSATISTSVTTGGTIPFQYSLNGVDFQAASDFPNLGAGDYTVTVKDANDCLASSSVTVGAGSNPSNLTFITSSINCTTGETDVQVTVQNGEAPFTYTIIAPSSINTADDTFIALSPNTYTFEVVSNNGCKIVRNFTVPEPIKFTTNASVKNNVSCATAGSSDGSIELAIENFNSSFNVIIEDGAGTDTGLGVSGATSSPIVFTGLLADTYNLRISDESGTCEKSETVTIAAPATPLTLDSFVVANMNCGTPGAVTIEASGGWGNYSYQVAQPDATLTPVQSNKTITGLTQSGTHTLILSDVNGCTIDGITFDLIDQGGPTATVDASASNYCYSSATTGALKIDVTDGEAPYFYTVNNGTPQLISAGTFTLSGLTPDNYLIKVIGNNGCETVVANTMISGQLFALAQITKPLGCGVTPDAIIQINAEEGYPAYTYEVSVDGTSFATAANPFSASSTGTYTFRVTDLKGCVTTTAPVEVINSPPLIANPTISPTACGKDGTGAIELSATGGTPPYSYSFDGSPFSNQTLYGNLNATDYNFSIRDALGCELIDIVATITAEDAITADVTWTDISCDAVGGGTQWGNMNLNNVQNSTGLITIELVRVRSEANYLATGWSRAYRRRENIDMSTRPGGWNERMYWPQVFFVRVTDERGCSYESDFHQITQPPLPSFQKNQAFLDQTCANGATFEIQINGDPANPATLPGEELVGPFMARIWPYDPYSPPAWLDFQDIAENVAFGEDGEEAPGAPERDFRISGLLFGVQYGVTILDTNTGCQRFRNLGTVAAPSDDSAFDVISTVQGKVCRESNNGEVKFTISGAGDNNGDGVQNVSWKIYNAHRPNNAAFERADVADDGGTGGDIEISLTGLRGGWYVVEVTSETGCTSGNRFPIYTPAKLNLGLNNYVPATCNIGAQISVTATGGWNNETNYNRRNRLYQNWHPYEFAYVVNGTDPNTLPSSEWSADTVKEITPTAYDGTENVYQVYVRDGGGCVKGLGSPITITRDAVPEVDVVTVSNRCTSTDEIYDISVTMNSIGTNPVNSAPEYIWDGEVTNSTTKQLGPGTHTLVVRDENGCSVTESIFIYPQMVSKANITQVEQCSPANSGEVTIEVYGGSTDYTFTRLDNSESNATGIFTGLTHSTAYNFEVIDNQSGCPLQTVSATLDAPVAPDFQLVTPVQHISCFGANDGKISVMQTPTADNLDVAYTYSIDGNPYQTSNVFDNLLPGPHTLRVRSAKNCIQTLAAVTIDEPSELIVAGTLTSTFSCTADNNLGMATVVADVDNRGGPTGTGPYQYRFNNGSYSASDTVSLPYTLTSQTVVIDVIDANGCQDQTTVTIPAAVKVAATLSTTIAMNCAVDGVYEIALSAGVINYSINELPNASGVAVISGTTVTIDRGNPGNYVFEIADIDTGCTDTVSIEIAPFDTIEVVAEKTNDISCLAGSNGAFKFTVTGYTGTYDYTIYNTNAPTVPIGPTISENTITGEILVSTIPVGTYFVDIEATNTPQCKTESNHVTIQSPVDALSFTYNITQELSCAPGSDAQITATPTGGWGTYHFELVDLANPMVPIQEFDPNNIFNNLSSGITYRLTLEDLKGCSYFEDISIPQIDPIIVDPATITTVDPSCTTYADGSITVIGSRANGPSTYQYVLNNETTGVSSLAQTSNIFSDLVAGDYSVTVVDGFGCDTTSETRTLSDPTEIIINAAITAETTCTPDSGEITVSAIGGAGSYEYRIISPSLHPWRANPIYTSLAPGTYEFEARDAVNLCVSPISVIRTINSVDVLVVTVDDSNTTINCNMESDAVLVASASGGLGGYTYELQDDIGNILVAAQDSGIFENLGQGDYRIRAISGPDCEDLSEIFTIEEPPLLQATLALVEDVQCFAENIGSITINANGGERPYQYIISSEPTKASDMNTFEELASGTYSVIVQDAKGCEVVIDNIVVDGPTEAFVAAVTDFHDEECSTDDNGWIEISLNGGTAPYFYSLGDINGTYTAVSGPIHTFSDLDGGIFYEIYLKDANGCPQTLLQEIKTGVDLSATHETVFECVDGQPFGSTTITLLDETVQDYYFALDPADPNMPSSNDHSQDSPIFENLSAGAHTISIVHQGGCIEILNDIFIELPEPLVLTQQNGSINELLVSATGGDGQYTYYFEAVPQASGSLFVNRDGLYTVRVVDGKGCEAAIQISMVFTDIEIPNFFTPDNDGNNDVWIIENNEAFPNMFVSIYDRYGRTIKKFIGSGEWDGSYNNEDLPAGDYWYIIKLNGPNDEREFVGHFSIYR